MLLMTGPCPNTNCHSCPESLSLFWAPGCYELDLRPGATEEEILNICEQHCRSDYFVLITRIKRSGETFMLGAAMSAEAMRNLAIAFSKSAPDPTLRLSSRPYWSSRRTPLTH